MIDVHDRSLFSAPKKPVQRLLALKTRTFNYKLNIFPKDINRTARLLTKLKERKKRRNPRPDQSFAREKASKNTHHKTAGIQNIEETGSLTKPADQISFINFLESSYCCEIKM